MGAARTAVGIYDRMSKAEDAVRYLDDGGFPISQISVVARDFVSEKEVHGYIAAGDLGQDTLAAWYCGIFGLLVGAAFIWIPHYGSLVVAGPLAKALLSGIEGALAGVSRGELLGTLLSWGVPRARIREYDVQLREGKYLVIAHGSAEGIVKANAILMTTDLDDEQLHP